MLLREARCTDLLPLPPINNVHDLANLALRDEETIYYIIGDTIDLMRLAGFSGRRNILQCLLSDAEKTLFEQQPIEIASIDDMVCTVDELKSRFPGWEGAVSLFVNANYM